MTAIVAYPGGQQAASIDVHDINELDCPGGARSGLHGALERRAFMALHSDYGDFKAYRPTMREATTCGCPVEAFSAADRDWDIRRTAETILSSPRSNEDVTDSVLIVAFLLPVYSVADLDRNRCGPAEHCGRECPRTTTEASNTCPSSGETISWLRYRPHAWAAPLFGACT